MTVASNHAAVWSIYIQQIYLCFKDTFSMSDDTLQCLVITVTCVVGSSAIDNASSVYDTVHRLLRMLRLLWLPKKRSSSKARWSIVWTVGLFTETLLRQQMGDGKTEDELLNTQVGNINNFSACLQS